VSGALNEFDGVAGRNPAGRFVKQIRSITVRI
jgi:hypothetical protein